MSAGGVIVPPLFAFGQIAPPLAAHVQLAESMPFGNSSRTSVLGASTLPSLLTVIVYVTLPPGVRMPVGFAVLKIETCGAAGNVTVLSQGGVVPSLQTPPGGVALAVFAMLAGGAS